MLPAQAGLVVRAAGAGLAILLGVDLPARLGSVALAIGVVSAIRTDLSAPIYRY